LLQIFIKTTPHHRLLSFVAHLFARLWSPTLGGLSAQKYFNNLTRYLPLK
jgi:hypothetical protein